MSNPKPTFLRFTAAEGSALDFLVRADLIVQVLPAEDRDTKSPAVGITLLAFIDPRMAPRAVKGSVADVAEALKSVGIELGDATPKPSLAL